MTLTATGGDDDVSVVDYVQLSYPHVYRAESNALAFTLAGSSSGTVTGFSATAAGLKVIDLTNLQAPVQLAATVSTGGFSTHDASIGFYGSPAIEGIITLFMILGGSTFLLLARAVEGDWRGLWRDVQLRWYLTYIALFVLAIASWQVAVDGRPALSAVRASLFNVVSLATTIDH